MKAGICKFSPSYFHTATEPSLYFCCLLKLLRFDRSNSIHSFDAAYERQSKFFFHIGDDHNECVLKAFHSQTCAFCALHAFRKCAVSQQGSQLFLIEQYGQFWILNHANEMIAVWWSHLSCNKAKFSDAIGSDENYGTHIYNPKSMSYQNFNNSNNCAIWIGLHKMLMSTSLWVRGNMCWL